MDNLYPLDRIKASERSYVGDKALYLSQLLQQGYPVLPGFVVPAIAFWEFIEILGESEPLLADLPHSSLHVNVDDPHQLQLVAQQIRQAITAAPLPSVWQETLIAGAERVQAPAIILQPSLSLPSKKSSVKKLNVEDWADQRQPWGIWESYICLKHPAALALALKQVWAELFRARSLFYLQRAGVALHHLNVAVVVQPLNEAISSGTIKSGTDVWHIEATWGQGYAIAKGKVLPDSYQIQPQTGKILTSQLGSKTLAYRLSRELAAFTLTQEIPSEQLDLQPYFLSEAQQKQYALVEQDLEQLLDLCQQLKAELATPFCLEWAIGQSHSSTEPQLYITQFSPEPSLPNYASTSNLASKLVRGIPAAAGRVTALAQVMGDERPNLEAIAKGRILVAQSIAPDWLPLLQTAVGVVTEQGGMTSHGAIIARELGIPAVVSAVGVTQLIQTGELLLVDGNRGEIERLGTSANPPNPQLPTLNSQPPTPRFPIATQLLVNLSQTQSLKRLEGLPVDGVGLLRSELMILEALDNLHPQQWLRQGQEQELTDRLTQLIVQFAAALMPRPVLYRSLDWRAAEFQSLRDDTLLSASPVNSMLEQRGTSHYVKDPACFDVELAALGKVYACGYSNVQLMLPFVRTVEEFTFCRRRVEQAGLMDNPHFRLWIMAEVPSVLFLLSDYVKAGVQGISIGTNDLTQLLLAADRDRAELGSTLDARHPAVMRAIQQLIQMAKAAGIPCSICGQAPAQYPEIIDSLVQWGITSISVDVNDVEHTYMAIARAEQRLLLEAARQRIS
ncbi:MAG TPA: response regulator [Cyanobacteria bacterium UBA8803]|nr:response regulator [Cyanobacteria bacterium UBA8803]